MNLSEFSEKIDDFQKLRNDINEFHKLVEEIQADISVVNELDQHVNDCKKIKDELEAERKSHAEELRQINQDINILEDMQKALRAEKESKSQKLLETSQSVNTTRTTLNKCLEELGISELIDKCEQELKWEEKQSKLGLTSPAQTPGSSNPIFAMLSSLLQPSQNQQRHSQTSQSGPAGFLNRHRLPPQFVEASKLKKCENCGASIHRNAPTCPMCKMKTRSKNPKKKKKAAMNLI